MFSLALRPEDILVTSSRVVHLVDHSMQFSASGSSREIQGLPYGQPLHLSQYGNQPQQYAGMPLGQSQQMTQSNYGRYSTQSFQGQSQPLPLMQNQHQMAQYPGALQQSQQQAMQPHRMNTLSGPANPPTSYPDLSASRIGAGSQQQSIQSSQMVQSPAQQNGQGQVVTQQQQQQNQQQMTVNNSAQAQSQSSEPMSKEDRELFKPLQEARAAIEGMLREDEMAIPTMDGLLSSTYNDIDAKQNALQNIPHEAGSFVHTIGLIKADKSTFSSDIDFLLVIAGNEKIDMIGIGYNPSTSAIDVVYTGISVASPSNATFTQIVGTSIRSRIFLLGNGCIHELMYKSKGTLISKLKMEGRYVKNWTAALEYWRHLLPVINFKYESDIVQLAMDEERSVLYALTKSSKIMSFMVEPDDNLSAIQTIDNPIGQANSAIGGFSSFYQNSVSVISLSVIPRKESNTYRLMAILSSGARILFKPQYTYGGTSRNITFGHARSPPMTSGSYQSGNQLPTPLLQGNLVRGKYINGVFISSHRAENNQVQLFFSAVNTVRALNFYAEKNQNPSATYSELYQVKSHSLDISDIGEDVTFWRGDYDKSPTFRRLEDNAQTLLHELITEITVPRNRRFVVLSVDGLQVYEKSRPIDVLEKMYSQGQMSDLLVAYARNFDNRPAYFAAIAIAIASQIGNNNPTAALRVTDYHPSTAAQFALQHLVQFTEQVSRQQMLYGVSLDKASSPKIKMDAMNLQISRLLRPIWHSYVTYRDPQTGTQSSALLKATLQDIRERLEALHSVLSHRSDIFNATDASFGGSAGAMATIPQGNKDPCSMPRLLVQQTIEAIAFIILLIEFNLEMTVARCDPELQNALLNLRYCDLITQKHGREVAKKLVTSLINHQIGQQLSIESISEKLQERCGSFCRPEDVILYKAIENIRRAKEARSKSDRDIYLSEALELFVKAANALSVEKVQQYAKDFQALRYPLGCVQLPLEAAEKADSQHLAYGYYLDGQSESDPRRLSYESRQTYYRMVTSALEAFDEMIEQIHSSGRDVAGTVEERTREEAYDYALHSNDELFLVTLYDWYLEKGKSDELFELDNHHQVESYLRHRGVKAGDPRMLWKFYARRNRHYMAAEALRDLALNQDVDLPLNERVEYLAIALMHAKSPSTQPDERAPVDFVSDLEDLADVANVQMAIWQVIANAGESQGLSADLRLSKVQGLEKRLLTVQELYDEYAVPLHLYESMLALIKLSGARDDELTKDVWKALFDKAKNTASELSSPDKYQPYRNLTVNLGQNLYPSETAFPTSYVVTSLLEAGLDMPQAPFGWAVQACRDGHIPWRLVWETIQDLRQGQPPFHELSAEQYLDEQIAYILPRWIEEAISGRERDGSYFPAVDVDAFLSSWLLETKRAGAKPEIRETFENARKEIRRSF
ncbi:hypothetical protein QFC22_002550 [Naganishia vaughanmartiniae]|uniref:Uncharacterized protein n=1 Tax=Naganishia vaughanmartiniae TaxID=1424756 RepID=A0ACC2XAF4_9TREE|nr:hypothetical protein QFC22_002550 [Naganishia vaughanmartiniae]